MVCKKGTYEYMGDCYKLGTFDYVESANNEVVENQKQEGSNYNDSDVEKLTFKTVMVSSIIGFVFSAFMAWYFYRSQRTFLMWLFGVFAASSLSYAIVMGMGLQVLNRKK